MRKIGDAMAREVEIELPAHLARLAFGEIVKLLAGPAVVLPFLAHDVKQRARIFGGLCHLGIGAGQERIAAIAFPLLPDGADIEKEDIIRTKHDSGIGWRAESLGRIRAEADIDIVPASQHTLLAENVFRHRDGIFLDHARLHFGGDEMDRGTRLVADHQHGIARERGSDLLQVRLLDNVAHSSVPSVAEAWWTSQG